MKAFEYIVGKSENAKLYCNEKDAVKINAYSNPYILSVKQL